MSSGLYKFLLLLIGAVACLWLALPDFAVVDEQFHLEQIKRLANGDPTHLPNITTFIYLHQLYAWLGQWLPISDLLDYRLISAMFAGLWVLLLIRVVSAGNILFDWKLAGQLLFLPVIFPYLPLVYTDLPALSCLLLCAWLMYQKRFITGALTGALATWVRQPSLIWLGLLTLWAGYRCYTQQTDAFRAVKVMLPGVVVMLLFAGFFVFNDSVALGDKSHHRVSLNLTNGYFMLLMAAVIFMPLVVRQSNETWRLFITCRWLWLVFLAGMPLYLYTFEVSHPFNGTQLNMFLRNLTLNTLVTHWGWLLISYVLLFFCTLALISCPMRRPEFRALWLALPMSVVMMPLVEQRYYMMGFVLWLLCRQRFTDTVEGVLLLWMALISTSLYWGISQRWFYF